MESLDLTLKVISFLVFCTTLGFGTYLTGLTQHHPASRMFTAVTITLAMWFLSDLGLRIAVDENVARFWLAIYSFWPILTCLLWAWAIVYSGKIESTKSPLAALIIYVPALAFCIVYLATNLLELTPANTSLGWNGVTKDFNLVRALRLTWTFAIGGLIVFHLTRRISLHSWLTSSRTYWAIIAITLGALVAIIFGFILTIWLPDLTRLPIGRRPRLRYRHVPHFQNPYPDDYTG